MSATVKPPRLLWEGEVYYHSKNEHSGEMVRHSDHARLWIASEGEFQAEIRADRSLDGNYNWLSWRDIVECEMEVLFRAALREIVTQKPTADAEIVEKLRAEVDKLKKEAFAQENDDAARIVELEHENQTLKAQCAELAKQLAEVRRRDEPTLPMARSADSPAPKDEVGDTRPNVSALLATDTQAARLLKVLLAEGATAAADLPDKGNVPRANIYAVMSGLKRSGFARFVDGKWEATERATMVNVASNGSESQPKAMPEETATIPKMRFNVLVTLMENRGMTLTALIGFMSKRGIKELDVRNAVEDCKRLGYVTEDALCLDVNTEARAMVDAKIAEHERKTGKTLDRSALRVSAAL